MKSPFENISQLKMPPKSIDYLTVNEIEQLLNGNVHLLPIYILLTLALNTGMRVGEI